MTNLHKLKGNKIPTPTVIPARIIDGIIRFQAPSFIELKPSLIRPKKTFLCIKSIYAKVSRLAKTAITA